MGGRPRGLLRVDWDMALTGLAGTYFLRYLHAGARRTAGWLAAFRLTGELPVGALALGAGQLLVGVAGLGLLASHAIPSARRYTRQAAGLCALAWAASWGTWICWWVGTRAPGLPLFDSSPAWGRFLLRLAMGASLLWCGCRFLRRGPLLAGAAPPLALLGLDELRLRLPVLTAAAYRGTWGPGAADLLTVVLRAVGGIGLVGFGLLCWTGNPRSGNSRGYGAAAVAALSYALADLSLLYVNWVARLPLGWDLAVSLPFVAFALLVAARLSVEAWPPGRKTSPPDRIASGRGGSGAAQAGSEEAGDRGDGPSAPGQAAPGRQVDGGPGPGRVLGSSPLRQHIPAVLPPGSRSLDSPALRSPPRPPRPSRTLWPAPGPGLGRVSGR